MKLPAWLGSGQLIAFMFMVAAVCFKPPSASSYYVFGNSSQIQAVAVQVATPQDVLPVVRALGLGQSMAEGTELPLPVRTLLFKGKYKGLQQVESELDSVVASTLTAHQLFKSFGGSSPDVFVMVSSIAVAHGSRVGDVWIHSGENFTMPSLLSTKKWSATTEVMTIDKEAAAGSVARFHNTPFVSIKVGSDGTADVVKGVVESILQHFVEKALSEL